MHAYVEQTQNSYNVGASDGRAGYLRIKAGTDHDTVVALLREERDAAEAEVNKAPAALMSITAISEIMQLLILIELLLVDPTAPIDIRRLSSAQHCRSQDYLDERIEQAVLGLRMLAPVELVPTL